MLERQRGRRRRRFAFETLEERTVLAAAVSQMMWQGTQTEVYSDAWILGLTGFTGAADAQTARAQQLLSGLDAGYTIQIQRYLNSAGLFRIETTDGVAYSQLQGSLSSLDCFQYLEPDQVLQLNATPNDPSFSALWGLNNTGQTLGTTDADIDAPEAWNISTGSSSIVVGIVDTGVDYNHPDLAANIWANPGEIPDDGVDNDGNGFIDDVHGWDFVNDDSDPMDDDGHGTHVAGTIGAVGDNGVGVAGVNWHVQIMALKFLDETGHGATSDAVAAMNYANMMRRDYGVNIRVTNHSWSGSGYSQAMYNAINDSRQLDMLFVAAASNGGADGVGDDNDSTDTYPANYNLDNVIAVAATDHNDQLAGFSNYGATTVDLAAPGVSIRSTLPNNSYGSYNGTSMATPHVVGVAALAWSVAPSATYQQIRDAIFAGVDQIPSLAGKTVTGGRLNAYKTLALLGLQATAASPAPQSVVAAPPVDFTLNFSDPINGGSVAAGALFVNGLAADSFTLVDADTVTFHFNSSPVTAQGLQTLELSADSITRLSDGDGVGAYQTTFYYDAVPMQVVSVSPTIGSTAQTPIAAIDFTFNEAFDPASASINDLSVSQGTVVGVTVVSSNVLQFQVAGVDAEGPMTVQFAAGALSDVYGNPISPFSGSFTVDVGTLAMPTPMTPVLPLGSGVYETSKSAGVGVVGDSDAFTITLPAGRSFTVVVDPGAGLIAQVEVRDASAALVGSATSSAADQKAVLNSLATGAGGTFTITVQGASGTVGAYSVRVLLNGSVEGESNDGAGNGAAASAQSLDGTFVGVGAVQSTIVGIADGYVDNPPAEAEGNDSIATATSAIGSFQASSPNLYQLSAHGTISATSDVDWYAIGSLDVGDVLTIAMSGSPSVQGTLTNPLVDLYRGSSGSPTLVTTNADGGPGLDSLLWKFSITTADTYYIRARNTSSTGSYHLAAWLENSGSAPTTGGSSLSETESNNSAATANNFTSSWRQVNYASSVGGTISVGDVDFYKYQFNAGDVVTVNVNSTGGADARAAIVDANGIVLATEDGTSTGPGASSPIFAFRISTSGTYYVRVQAGSGSGAYTTEVRLSTSTAPPAATSIDDYYSVTLAAGEKLSAVALGVGAGTLQIDVRSPGDVSLASGAAGASNLTRTVEQFTAPSAGVYFVRVTGSQGLEYRLVVVRGGGFDAEPNDSSAAVSLDGSSGAVGYLNPNRPDVVGGAVFTIDASQSVIAFSGTAISTEGALPILEQAPGSLTTYIGGTLAASFNNGTITFAGGSNIDPQGHAGPFLPNNLPADFAARLDLLPPTIIAQLALRNTMFDALSGSLPMDAAGHFAADGLRFKILSGSLDYVVPLVLPAGSYNLSNLSASNESTTPATLQKLPDRWILTIPVFATAEFPEPTTGVLLDAELTGQVVATLMLDPPIDPVDQYSITLAAGQSVHLATQTPLDSAGNLGPHGLNPRIVLLDPNGVQVAFDADSGADGRNASLTFQATTSGVYTVQVIADGQGQGEYTLTSSVVSNAPPTAAIAGPTSGVRGQPRTYTLTAADDFSSVFTFHLDWNGDGVFDETLVGASGVQISHVFATSGSYQVAVFAEDSEGAAGPAASLGVAIVDWTLQVDEADPSKTNFVVGGTGGVDAFGFLPGVMLVQMLNNQFYLQPQAVFTGSFNGKLIVYAQGGSDLVLADVMSAPVEFHGGVGDDVLIGGRGADWIDGGAGNDILFGGTLESDAGDVLLGGDGDDLIVGHWGPDTIHGGAGEDLIVAGRLLYLNLPASVYSIQSEWTSGRPYQQRVDNLLGVGSGPRLNGDVFLVPGSSALDDGVVDDVFGDDGVDWLLFDSDQDVAPDLAAGVEIKTELL